MDQTSDQTSDQPSALLNRVNLEHQEMPARYRALTFSREKRNT